MQVRIEQSILFADSDGTLANLAPDGEPILLAPLLRLSRGRLSQLEAYKNGVLEIAFEDNIALTVASSVEFEPWDIVGQNGFRIVSMPGGKLAVWSATE